MSETGRVKFKRNKILISVLVKFFMVFPKSFLLFFWNCTSNHSQVVFIGIRYIILKVLTKACGDNIKIGTNVQILGWENLSLGENISIHSNCYVDANGEVEIGDNVSIAHNSTILSTNHDWTDSTTPIKYNPVMFEKVEISDDVWIGCGCRILAGVRIRERAIIAAGAVVNKEVKSRTIVGGVPAKVIKDI
ncbi:acyltransferase [Tenacibaculum sp. IB213877]|uniref:acyltransferase n=1 Tax=Tenacibaculum sp. IB213877 TaxID=3097351 RepID=UPI002A5A6677|nr:acyltransferase [Tenacibaculum sp. IB213877]MDY0781370.1 acyltransferase [Tenacibaculum sp. IB213877]